MLPEAALPVELKDAAAVGGEEAELGVVPRAPLDVLVGVALVLGGRRHHARFFAIALPLSVLLVFDTPLLRLLYEVVPLLTEEFKKALA